MSKVNDCTVGEYYYTVSDLIDDLKRFNPRAKILNTIQISWSAEDGDDVNESKLATDKVWIFDESYGEENEG